MNTWINHPSFPDEPSPSDWSDEPSEIERYGLTFTIVWDHEGQRWLHVADTDGRVIAFEQMLVEPALSEIVDDWIQDRVHELTPDHRCDECDLPVEIVSSGLPCALNHAIQVELTGGFVGWKERGRERITLCAGCLNNLRNQHEWFDNLLDAARARRRQFR